MNITGILLAYIIIQFLSILVQKLRRPAEDSGVAEFRNSGFVLAIGIFGFLMLICLLALPYLRQYVGPIIGSGREYYFLVTLLAVFCIVPVMAYSGERVRITKDELEYRNMFYITKKFRRRDITTVRLRKNKIVLYSGEEKLLSISSMFDNYTQIAYMLEDSGSSIELGL